MADLAALEPLRGGQLLNLGTDVIECARIERVYTRQRERFLARVFTEAERDYCLSMGNPIPHLAARFAAKEAVSKCFTTGIGAYFGWRSVAVLPGARGQPVVTLDAQGQQLLEHFGAARVCVSLAHTEVYGHAVAALLG